MPFVFNASYDYLTNTCYFNFDLKYWCFQDKNVITILSNKLKLFQSQLEEISTQNEYKVDQVAKVAIKNAALSKYVHNDLEFRHIGLLPIFDEEENLVSLRPVLIDFAIVIKVSNVNDTEKKMLDKFEYISQNVDFI